MEATHERAATASTASVQLLKAEGSWGKQTVGILQAFLKIVGVDPGPLDCEWGMRSKCAMHVFLKRNGYVIRDVGADFDGDSVRAMQQWLVDSGFQCKGGVDGRWGRGTTSTLQDYLNSVQGLQFGPIAVDSQFGPESCRALQGFLVQHGQVRIPIDGGFGAQTRRTLQSFLKDAGYYHGSVDGAFGPQSITGLQRWLLSGGIGNDALVEEQQSLGGFDDGIWRDSTTRCLQEFLNTLNAQTTRVVTMVCTIQQGGQLAISCTSLAGEVLATLNADLDDSIGRFRGRLAAHLSLSEHRVALVHPDGRGLDRNRMTFAELLGGELLSDLLAGNLALPELRSNSGFLVCGSEA